jgi:hypothetical protein
VTDLDIPRQPVCPVNWRSVGLGIVGTLIICGLTSYNDFALNNTYLVGNNMPIGVILLLFLFAICVNGPLNLWKPRWAFSAAELTVALSMTLASCALPSSGLMRYFIPSLVMPFFHAQGNVDYAAILKGLHLKKWLFPQFSRGTEFVDWESDPLVQGYVSRWLGAGPGSYLAWITPPLTIGWGAILGSGVLAGLVATLGRAQEAVRNILKWLAFALVAYAAVICTLGFMRGQWMGAWVRPGLSWGIFLFALYGAMACMVSLVRRQWVENERLAFPLAQIYLTLLEQPAPGQYFAPILRRSAFWIPFAAVFLVHIWNGLGSYFPRDIPKIPLTFDLTNVFKEHPWNYTDADSFQKATIYFTAVGVTYFLPNSVSFSLWFFFIANQFWRMGQGALTGDQNNPGRSEDYFGGCVAFTLSVLWVGRHHWKLVISQALRGHRAGEPRGRYLPFPLAVWGFAGCATVMVVWMWLAGSSIFGAVSTLAVLFLAFFVITRIIAETGLVHGQLSMPVQKPVDLLVDASVWFPSLRAPVSTDSYFLSSMINGVHYDYREVFPVYASHDLRVADQTIFGGQPSREDEQRDRKLGRKLMGCIMLALVIGYWVSFFSHLHTFYMNSTTHDQTHASPIDDWGVHDSQWLILQPTVDYTRATGQRQYNPWMHLTVGFSAVSFMAIMRWRYAWWPLHPIGYLMIDTFPGNKLWASIFLGWLAKSLIVRFGGARAYTRAKTFFLGMIVGEAIAAGVWLVASVALDLMHFDYRVVRIMPI